MPALTDVAPDNPETETQAEPQASPGIPKLLERPAEEQVAPPGKWTPPDPILKDEPWVPPDPVLGKTEDDADRAEAIAHLNLGRAGIHDLSLAEAQKLELIAQHGKSGLGRAWEKTAAAVTGIPAAAEGVYNWVQQRRDSQTPEQRDHAMKVAMGVEMPTSAEVHEAWEQTKNFVKETPVALAKVASDIPDIYASMRNLGINPLLPGAGMAPAFGMVKSFLTNDQDAQAKRSAVADVIRSKVEAASNEYAQKTGLDRNSVGAAIMDQIPYLAIPAGGAGEAGNIDRLVGQALRQYEKAGAATRLGLTKVAPAAASAAKFTAVDVAAKKLGIPHGASEFIAAWAGLRGPLGRWHLTNTELADQISKAVSGLPLDEIARESKVMMADQSTRPLVKVAEEAARQRAQELREAADGLKRKIKPERGPNNEILPLEVDEVNSAGRFKYETQDLPPAQKPIREKQLLASALEKRADIFKSRSSLQKVLDDADRYVGNIAAHTIIGAGVGGAFAGTTSTTGDTSAMGQGTLAGALFAGVPSPVTSIHGMKAGRLAEGAEALRARGLKAVDPADLAKVPPPAKNYVLKMGGAIDGLGVKVKIHTPEEMQAKEPTNPYGFYDPTTKTINLRSDAVGAAGHEVMHPIQQLHQLFGEMLGDSDPALMKQFEEDYSKKTGGKKFNTTEERDAEVGRIVLEQTPIEYFYGGERGVDVLARVRDNILNKVLPGKTQIDPTLKAPYSAADVSAMKQRLFKVGEHIARPVEEFEAFRQAKNAALSPEETKARQDAVDGLNAINNNRTNKSQKAVEELVDQKLRELKAAGKPVTIHDLMSAQQPAAQKPPKFMPGGDEVQLPNGLTKEENDRYEEIKANPEPTTEEADEFSALNNKIVSTMERDSEFRVKNPDITDFTKEHPVRKYMPEGEKPEREPSDKITSQAVRVSGITFPGKTWKAAKEAAAAFGFDPEDIAKAERGYVTKKGPFLSQDEASQKGVDVRQFPEGTEDLPLRAKTFKGKDRKFMPAAKIETADLSPERMEELKSDRNVVWHGSPNGDLRGGDTGLHVGTFEAARQALEARIGRPAEGYWDGTREYGRTLLKGQDSIKGDDHYPYVSGYNTDAPEEDYYPTGKATFSNKEPIPLDSKPVIAPFRITGKMSNDPSRPHGDWQANGRMRGLLKKGNAKSGYYYRNIGEDSGSISAVVPSWQHVDQVKFMPAAPEAHDNLRKAVEDFTGDEAKMIPFDKETLEERKANMMRYVTPSNAVTYARSLAAHGKMDPNAASDLIKAAQQYRDSGKDILPPAEDQRVNPQTKKIIPERYYAKNDGSIIDRLTGKSVSAVYEGEDAGDMLEDFNRDNQPLPLSWERSHPDANIPESFTKNDDGTFSLVMTDRSHKGSFATEEEAQKALSEEPPGDLPELPAPRDRKFMPATEEDELPSIALSTAPGIERGFNPKFGYPALQQLHDRMLKQLAPNDSFRFLDDAGIKNHVEETIGQFQGGREPSFVLRLPNADFESTQHVASILGDALLQDAVIPVEYSVNGSQLGLELKAPKGQISPENIASFSDWANEHGHDNTIWKDGSRIVLFDPKMFGEDPYGQTQFNDFARQIQPVAEQLGLTARQFRQNSDYISHGDYQQRLSQTDPAGGAGGRSALQAGAARSLYPEAKAIQSKFFNEQGFEPTGQFPQVEEDRRQFMPAANELLRNPLRKEGEKPLKSHAGVLIKPAGEGGQPRFPDLQRALDQWSKAGGAQADPGLKREIAQAIPEIRYQLQAEGGKGMGWYKDDVDKAVARVQPLVPAVAEPVKNKLFRLITAGLSYGKDPWNNLTESVHAMNGYDETGVIPLDKGEIGYSGYPGSIHSLRKIQHVIDKLGEEKAVDWFLTKHPISEIRDMFSEGQFNVTIRGRQADSAYGAMAFGPKGGPFALNLNGITDHTTVDVWGARSLRRWRGQLSEFLGKTSEGNADYARESDAPPTGAEIRDFHSLTQTVAKRLKISPDDVQALLWYFEHRLYEIHGVGDKALSYRDAAEKMMQNYEQSKPPETNQPTGTDVREAEGSVVSPF